MRCTVRLFLFSTGNYLMKSLFIVPHSETTAHIIVPHVLKALNAAGYKMVTLAECLNMQPYQSVTSPQQVTIINLTIVLLSDWSHLGFVDLPPVVVTPKIHDQLSLIPILNVDICNEYPFASHPTFIRITIITSSHSCSPSI